MSALSYDNQLSATQAIDSSQLFSLSKTERQLFLQYCQGPQVRLPHTCLHHAFAQQLQQQPNAIAIIDGQQQLTYKQLDQQAHALAIQLQQSGVSHGDAVGIFLRRGSTMIIAMLACFKIGAAYVPQHVGVTPKQQLHYICQQAKIQLVLTLDEFITELNFINCQLLAVDTWLTQYNTKPQKSNAVLKHPPPSQGSDTAFILFTSGTTGDPNGVQISHQNVCNILLTAPGNLSIGPGVIVSQLLSIAFDMAAWEIWGSLCNGGTLIIRGQSIPETAEQAHIIIATPSILATINPQRCHHILRVIVAGEPCPESLALKWSQHCDFYNSCGPTETTIINTAAPYHPYKKPLSIGQPTPNNTVYILDDKLQPCPIGEVGMMWGGGDCVTKGYINNEHLNQERYQDDPFLGKGRKMFRTGDLGRWNQYGELEHYGRADDQVKVCGFRVELDAVSSTIEQLAGVERAVTLKYNQRQLISFICGTEYDTATVQTQVNTHLPYYYVPAKVFHLPQLPQTPRGKIDKRQLMNIARQQFKKSAMETIA